MEIRTPHAMSVPMIETIRREPELWNLFTRKEEYLPAVRDQYDRFPYCMSRDRDIFLPRVSTHLIENGYDVEYPDGRPFALCLTHDIDHVYRSGIDKGWSAIRGLRHRDLQKTWGSISQMHSSKLPLCNFNEIMSLEERFDAKSTFFFMAESPGERAYTYDIEDLGHEIGEILDRGWEIGLHGGLSTYLDEHEMRAKKQRLERVTSRPVLGYRNHFLCFRVPETWEYLSRAGFRYDSTLGYGDCAGFRNGMCHPFNPFNLNTSAEIDIREIPLTLMDGVLDSTHMRLGDDAKWHLIKMLIDTTAKYHGVFTLLWHNTFMDGEDLRLYKKILQYCREKNAWITNGAELYSTGLS